MLFAKLLAPLLLIVPIIADGVSITRSLLIVSNSTARLGILVDNWTGTRAGAVPIMRQSKRIIRQLRQGARAANVSQALTVPEVAQLQDAILQLTDVTNATMGSLVNRQKDFEKVRLTKTVKNALLRQRSRANKLSNAIMVKVPQEVAVQAKQVSSGIDGIFANALTFFK